ncbi:MAG TPA: acyloxyacyl hydrolase [Cyclobacteriaceae bacterium]|nr:acyloxyacyl hydrolase [Cyclobacteriaceae bacterium]
MIPFPVLAQLSDSLPVRSGNRTAALSLGARIHYGSFMANKPKLQYVQDSHTMLAELDILARTYGRHSWEQPSNYPQIGLAFLYGQSGASRYIGHLAAILPFMNFSLYKTGGFSTDLRLAVGPAWVEKIFDHVNNYQNMVIGSHLNACLNILFSSRIRILPRTDLDLGISFTHISNGSFKLPNMGLNIPALSAGIRYDLHSDQVKIRRSFPPVKKKINYYFYASIAGKQSLPLGSARYLVNIFNLEALRDFSRTGRIGGGINMTLDRAQSVEVPYSPVFAFDRSKSQWQGSVYLAYEYVIGNLSLPLQVGYYLYNNYPVNSIYQNIGIKYRFASHWTAAFALKAHMGNGDFIQWGIGYKF